MNTVATDPRIGSGRTRVANTDCHIRRPGLKDSPRWRRLWRKRAQKPGPVRAVAVW